MSFCLVLREVDLIKYFVERPYELLHQLRVMLHPERRQGTEHQHIPGSVFHKFRYGYPLVFGVYHDELLDAEHILKPLLGKRIHLGIYFHVIMVDGQRIAENVLYSRLFALLLECQRSRHCVAVTDADSFVSEPLCLIDPYGYVTGAVQQLKGRVYSQIYEWD